MPVRLIAVFLSLAFLVPAAVAQAGEADTGNPVLMSYATPELVPELFGDDQDDVRTASFCGACQEHSACGEGWRCCPDGCSGGLKKCYEVVSCDKLADETGGPLRLFASR